MLIHSAATLRFKGYDYTIEKALMNYVQISVSNGKTTLLTLITIVEINHDSVDVVWKGEGDAELNPVKRINLFLTKEDIQKDIADILLRLKMFLENKENVYGININQTRVTDTILITKKFISNAYPTTSEIYATIKDLRTYISREGARETNPPMLNIAREGINFRTMIALPISNEVAGKNDFVLKRMVPGKILVAEVKGGRYSTNEALHQMDLYLIDHNLSSPAIPFQSLITDRSQQPDTTRWTTKVYYPIY